MCRPATPTTAAAADSQSKFSKGEESSAFHKRSPGQKKNQHKLPPAVYFTWGRLRIGFHAICATLSFFVTIVAWLTISRSWIFASVLLNSATAWDARNLISQVPLKTEILPGIVAPHKEAFKRTMSMMHYVNLRILGQLLDIQTTSTLYQMVCWAFGWYFFAPVSSDFRNGNTWIFVVPMFAAVVTDIPQLMLRDALQTSHYLLIELSALIIAFGFTVAFRGYVSVPKFYLGSALYVAALFLGVMRIILFSTPTLEDKTVPRMI